jgi:ribosomal protein S18 acetylase RimI-like enzyme
MTAAPRVWCAAPSEAGDVARLLAGFRDWMGRDDPDEASIRASVDRLIGREDTEYLLATAGEGGPAAGVAGPRPAGAAGAPPAGVAQLRFRWGVWWAAEDCELEDLFVDASARGAGLGRALAEAAIARARERGCRRIQLDANTHNPPALALYRSLGFRTGRGEDQDLLMRLHLQQ